MKQLPVARLPSERVVKQRLKELREYIDDNLMTNPVEARVAYIWETAIRWATEKTTWPAPLEHIEFDAQLLRSEVRQSLAGVSSEPTEQEN